MSAVMEHPFVHLRPMQEADLTHVLAMEQVVYPFGWSEGIFRDCLAGDYLCRIAEDEQGGLCGYAISSVAVGEQHILNLVIDPARQGRGLGRQLLRALLDEGACSGAERAFLEVRISNQVARRLYTSVGFLELGLRKNYYPSNEGREDAIVLAITLGG